MTKAEKEAYFRHLDSLMQHNDAYDTAISSGMAKGLAEGRASGLGDKRSELQGGFAVLQFRFM